MAFGETVFFMGQTACFFSHRSRWPNPGKIFVCCLVLFWGHCETSRAEGNYIFSVESSEESLTPEDMKSSTGSFGNFKGNNREIEPDDNPSKGGFGQEGNFDREYEPDDSASSSGFDTPEKLPIKENGPTRLGQ